jgi:hypothetical protein
VQPPTHAGEDQLLTPDRVPFDGACGQFQRALDERLPVASLQIMLAGFALRIRVIGEQLAQSLLPPLAHLPRPSPANARVDLSIDVWSTTETRIPAPSTAAAASPKSMILLKASTDGRYVGEQRAHGELWLDRQSDRIAGWFGSADELNLDERARPFHKLLSAWLEERGVQFIHAGLVCGSRFGMLFVGNGGAGKSTSSIACLRAGMPFLGDDFVGFSRDGGRLIGHGMYGTCLLNVDHIRRFPDLEQISRKAYHAFEDKSVVLLQHAFPDAIEHRTELGALLLPRVVRGETSSRVRPALKAEALRAIAPTSVMFLPRPSAAAFERLAGLVQTLPSFWLELGSNVDQICDAVRQVESLVEERGAA